MTIEKDYSSRAMENGNVASIKKNTLTKRAKGVEPSTFTLAT